MKKHKTVKNTQPSVSLRDVLVQDDHSFDQPSPKPEYPILTAESLMAAFYKGYNTKFKGKSLCSKKRQPSVKKKG